MEPLQRYGAAVPLSAKGGQLARTSSGQSVFNFLATSYLCTVLCQPTSVRSKYDCSRVARTITGLFAVQVGMELPVFLFVNGISILATLLTLLIQLQ